MLFGALAIVSAGMTSCGDYLDVRPKSEVPADLHFERESGYKDQLTGVYTQMCNTTLYGRNLSYGLMEVLAQNYDVDAAGSYYYASRYNYTATGTRMMIDGIWTDAYNCIANLNIMLEYIDNADKNIFSGNNYAIYKGEALGLRAFLHFELLRLFAPSYASNSSATGIPYVTEYKPAVTKHIPVKDALELIIKDLTEARTLLIDTDPLSIVPHAEKYYYRGGGSDERNRYFNYYAVEAALARAYMYKGDKTNALTHAMVIVNEGEYTDANGNSIGAFPWTHYTSMEAALPADNDRRYTSEQLFLLNITDMEDNIQYFMTSSAGVNTLAPGDEKIKLIFEESAGLGNDYRRRFWFQYSGDRYYFSKFWQYEGSKYNNFMPIIRKTEFYYMAAEILNETSQADAVAMLNLVRSHRAIPELPADLTKTQVQDEVFKEVRKELLGEGQLFHYYKRLNLSTIEGAGITAGNAVYVLPKPDNEIEFGDVD